MIQMSKEILYAEHDGFFFYPPPTITRGGYKYKINSHFIFKDNAILSAKGMRSRGHKAFILKQTGVKINNAKVTKGGKLYFMYNCPLTETEYTKRKAREEKAWRKKLERRK